MESLYKPEGVEERWQRTWEEEGLYRAGAGARRDETFVICVPPPNVTGALHMGHALNGSIQDVLIRWHRMRGFDTLWQPGYDHAGISTQNVVEKQLVREGTSRKELGREAFVERVWEHLNATGPHDHGPVPPPRRLARLRARALHDGRRLHRGRDALLRPPLGPRLDLPREPDRQLVPVPRDGDLRPRGRARGDRRRAHVRALPVRRRVRARSRSRPCGPRRCSATSPSPCIPTTSATATRSARRCSCRSSSGAVPVIADERVDPEFGTGALKVTPGARPDGLRDRPRPRRCPS